MNDSCTKGGKKEIRRLAINKARKVFGILASFLFNPFSESKLNLV